ncbi:hypothetical protein TD95_003763 [Thielaviopsis punctulata]|uniref:Phytanoyl-CoA dioxygenase family protein n=1 Tax=Thielaviopsis punctulata TaxID=72032 RepID=A0A0F4ZIU6_9PEZI|nr:hypothetical protein TD95_003763 [Thielaviopsis punctulata]
MAYALTDQQKHFFVQHGWLHLKQCFTRAQAESMTSNVWQRLGMNPNDKSTWTQSNIHMPGHRTFDAREFAPKAWSAICELSGGEERIHEWSRWWHDALIVNLGSAEKEGGPDSPHDLWGWHVDGDFFVHYLDSPEQGLLVIPLFTDIAPAAGGTVICPEAMPVLARHLYNHPEGVSPLMDTRDSPDFRNIETGKGTTWYNDVAHKAIIFQSAQCNTSPILTFSKCVNFVEACGEAGDVFLLHPLILHTASNNPLRHLRIITNPAIGLRQPFNFSRPDGKYSLVERSTLRALGRENLAGWHITKPREAMVPHRIKVQEKMKAQEQARMRS